MSRLTIDLPPESKRPLAEAAAERGQSVPEYARRLLERSTGAAGAEAAPVTGGWPKGEEVGDFLAGSRAGTDAS